MAAPNRTWTFDRFSYGTEKDAARITEEHFAPVSDRFVFNPSAKGHAHGWKGDVGGREYQKWLEAEKRLYQDAWKEKEQYMASFDVAYDYSQGLFGKPKAVQPAAQRIAAKLGKPVEAVVEEHTHPLHGLIGRQTTHMDAFDALKIRDPETGKMRYTDGNNDGWDPQGKAAELDQAARASVAFGKGERRRPGSTRYGAVRMQMANPSTGESRFVRSGPDAAATELDAATDLLFARASEASKAGPVTNFVACAARDEDADFAHKRAGALVGTPSADWCARRGPGDFYPFDQLGRDFALSD